MIFGFEREKIMLTTPGLNRRQQATQKIFVSLNRLVRGYRERRAERILDLFRREDVRSVLDVGTGAGQFWNVVKDKLEAVKIIGVDIRRPDRFPYGSFVMGSGSSLPFRDGSVDCVVCNSVIEHVGSYHAQQRLAAEIQRVARRLYVIQVPAKHFPVEPHFMLPWVQYLPHRLKRAIHRYLYGFDPGDIHLPDCASIRRLFPDALIEKETFAFLTKSFIVVGRSPRKIQ